jgi:hypothetical protein
MLTLYIIHGGKDSVEKITKAAESWGKELVSQVIVLKEGHFGILIPKTPWKAFIYADEVLSDEVRESLQTFLEAPENWDYFSLYRRSTEGQFSIAPRIFKSSIKLLDSAPYPEDINQLKGIIILDGMILEQT